MRWQVSTELHITPTKFISETRDSITSRKLEPKCENDLLTAYSH